MTLTFDANENPSRFRLCLFDNCSSSSSSVSSSSSSSSSSSLRTCWLIDGRHKLNDVEPFVHSNRCNNNVNGVGGNGNDCGGGDGKGDCCDDNEKISLSLLHAERVDVWTCTNVMQALGDCASWLVDTKEINSFLGRTAKQQQQQQQHSNNNSGKKSSTVSEHDRAQVVQAVASFTEFGRQRKLSTPFESRKSVIINNQYFI